MKTETKVRGVFFRDGAWWVQYYDSSGRRRREKIGTKGNAIKLANKRRFERLVGKKLPENMRTPPVTLGELAKAALQYSAAHKRSYRADESRMKNVVEQFEHRPAEDITPESIENWLESHTDWTVATKNRHVALIKLVYSTGRESEKDQDQSYSVGAAAQREQRAHPVPVIPGRVHPSRRHRKELYRSHARI